MIEQPNSYCFQVYKDHFKCHSFAREIRSDILVSLVRDSSAPRNSRPEPRVTRKRIRGVNSLGYENWYTRHLGRPKAVMALNNRRFGLDGLLDFEVTFEREIWSRLGLAAV